MRSRLRLASLTAVVALGCAITTGHVRAQTSPAKRPITAAPDMPLADYLGLLHQLAPAAAEGATLYLGAVRLQCARTLSTTELRQALERDGGDPVLMGLIRASHAQDAASRARLVRQVRCPTGAAR